LCPACGHHVAVPFYEGGRQPLTTLAWPQTAAEAESMPRLPLSFVRCVDCGHVFNREFEYTEVPYADKPYYMFNRGATWGDHLQRVQTLILEHTPREPTIVEIGCGDGHLLQALAACRPAGRYVGFDRNMVNDSQEGVFEARRTLFDPAVHLAELRPDMIISRHVLEHLIDPLGFIQALAFATSWEGIRTRLFIEVPCIDHVFSTDRTADFFYEHNSHFTSTSLERLLIRCAADVEMVDKGYNGEVVYGIAVFRKRTDQVAIAQQALAFHDRVAQAGATVRRMLDDLARSGRRVAIWGGTGKAAAFINQYRLDRDRFPLVVDSDPKKAGSFVPGTGQEIRFRDYLIEHPVEVILVATQWRAADIVLEIRRSGISFDAILLEHQGRLADYFHDRHPYWPPGAANETVSVRADVHAPIAPPNLPLSTPQVPSTR